MTRWRCARAAACRSRRSTSLEEIAHLIDVRDGRRDARARGSPARQPGDRAPGERRASPVALTDGIAPDTDPTCSTRSRISPNGAVSSSSRPRSTGDSAPPTTTARWASTCCATSSRPGGARWSRCAPTSSGSTRRSSARPPSGRRRATSRPSPTRWSTVESARSAGARTRSTASVRTAARPSSPSRGPST